MSWHCVGQFGADWVISFRSIFLLGRLAPGFIGKLGSYIVGHRDDPLLMIAACSHDPNCFSTLVEWGLQVQHERVRAIFPSSRRLS